ncbi:MAG: hypothetical protein SFW67_12520 [Myxococcaceae bacterium]|nr:hypothetical protein [Myxococcaceae bacterium]
MSQPESPWQVVQRLEDEGLSRASIVAELRTRGLDQADIDALLADGVAPSAARAPRVVAADLRPLEAAELRARCGEHPTLAAVGTCTRCGRFGCAACLRPAAVERELLGLCEACRASGVIQGDVARRARERAAWWMLSAPALFSLLLLAARLERPEWTLKDLKRWGLFSIPWLVLFIAQRHSRTFLPTWVSLLVWIATALLFAWAGGEVGGNVAVILVPWSLALAPALIAARAHSR